MKNNTYWSICTKIIYDKYFYCSDIQKSKKDDLCTNYLGHSKTLF